MTSISFSVIEKSFVKLKVYDILGNQLVVLVNELKEPGIHTVSFDASNIPSGIYFYNMSVTGETGNYSSTRKMLVVK